MMNDSIHVLMSSRAATVASTGPARPGLGMMLVAQDHVGHAHLWPGTGSAPKELLLMPLYQPDDLTITLCGKKNAHLRKRLGASSRGEAEGVDWKV